MTRVVVVVGGLALSLLVLAVLAFGVYWDHYRVSFPELEAIDEMYWLDQNWSEEDRQFFYHTTQGTKLVELDWLLALEQPKLLVWGRAPKFLDNDYIRGFGLYPNRHRENNPHGLPVGLAVDETWMDPDTKQVNAVVGLSCAACHTGQIQYNGIAMRIDGGSAHADIIKLSQELGTALVLTYYLPDRFNRFARNVLGDQFRSDRRAELKKDLSSTVAQLKKLGKIQKEFYPTVEGPGRLDALARIGNFVFGVDMDDEENLRIGDAPVSFPPLWDTSWFDWVQYDGSIRQPMMRNISEALGVFAGLNLKEPKELARSTVPVDKLHKIETLLGGPAPYEGLRSPEWPEEILGPLDQDARERGRGLYQKHCQGCHRPAMDSEAFWDAGHWEAPNEWGKSFFKVAMIPREIIGTDPNVLENFNSRTVMFRVPLPGDPQKPSLGEGLKIISEAIMTREYGAMGLDEEQKAEWNGYRADCLQVEDKYRARPLNGIWATAPYLHNGSVPNLYEMLLPAEERSRRFYVGSQEFDPERVGFRTEKFPGGFRFDVRHPGNSNAGHEFKDAPRGNGVIGPALEERERYDLIEYLKGLPGKPPGSPPARTDSRSETCSPPSTS